MELREVGQVVVTLLGLGVTGVVADYILKDRGARRAALRPRDMERIEVVRGYVRAIEDARRIPVNRRDETFRDLFGRFRGMAVVRDRDSTRQVVLQLADRRLTRTWSRFADEGWKAIARLQDRNVAFVDAVEADRLLVELCGQLRARLDRLERTR